jgi:Flp pilus assembly protein TadB
MLFAGSTLLLVELRWFGRRPLHERLAPYLPGQARTDAPLGLVASLQKLAALWALGIGASLTRLLGLGEEVQLRLDRVHASTSATEFRLRQLGWALGGFTVAALIVVATQPPAFIALLFVFGAPVLGHLLVEQGLVRSARRWQRRLFLELPVVSEQLGMLLSAGFSVGAGLNRLAETGSGACARDLQRVCRRMRHGVDEHAALEEWADVSGVPAVARLVAVLSLDRDASDLGRLITEESRAVRREVHRELIETIERRAQQVWIPVTVATLVPGALFLIVPFMTAMQLFAGS